MVVFVEVYLILVLISALIVGILIRNAPIVEDEIMRGKAYLKSRFPEK